MLLPYIFGHQPSQIQSSMTRKSPHLARLNSGLMALFAPFCNSGEHVKAVPPEAMKGKRTGEPTKGWYHCNPCRKKFTVRVGTLYERSHIPLSKWLHATYLLCASKKGMFALQLHRMLGVARKTAWFTAHRIREGMRETTPGPLGGEGKRVEIDESFRRRT
jgi:transposase-like protein